ncbi:MAG TPA: hypothetical protein DGP39_03680 [Verrucomicrobiales bacterium]|nr:hypothetical protein [Verrucomicrobiales bacterium]|tara:strand:+ start:888 stop:1088 length:201 start_codon:yes stop_codon:yes gene_type:complete
MDDPSQEFVKLSVRELKENLEQAEARLTEINEAAELAFKVIKEREDQTLNKIAALRAEIKKRSGRG